MAEEQTTLKARDMTEAEMGQVGAPASFKKPKLEKMTKALITNAIVKILDPIKLDRKGGKYKEAYFQVSFKVEGINENVVENYGFRLYDRDGVVSPYYGEEAYSGKFRQAAIEYLNLDKNIGLLPFVKAIIGKTANIISEETTWQNEKKVKQAVKSFVV